VWSLVTEQVIQVLKEHSDWAWSVAVSSDGEYAVSAIRDKTLRVWSLLLESYFWKAD